MECLACSLEFLHWLPRLCPRYQGDSKPMVTIVCGNKADLPKRTVSQEEAQKWAAARGFRYRPWRWLLLRYHQ